MTSSWFFLSTLNYDARSTTRQSILQLHTSPVTVLSDNTFYRKTHLQNTNQQPANLLLIDKSHQMTQLNQINSTQRIVHQLLTKLEKQEIPS